MTKTTSSRIEELPRVWTPEAGWTILQDQEEIATFLFPAFGPGNYEKVIAQVLSNRERGANLPRGEQLAFLLDEAHNSANAKVKKSPRSEFVRKDIMYNGWLWVHHVNVWTPRKIKNPGMYSVFDEHGQGLDKEYTIEELEDRLNGGSTERGVRFSEDRRVAFAPLNTFRPGYHKKGTLSQDGAFIANYGVKGAEALDRVAEQFRLNPYSLIVNNDSDKPIQSLSALYGGRNLDDDRLGANFNSGGDYRDGYVVSVSGSNINAEGSVPKK